MEKNQTHRILIADDNQANCELLEAYLANMDCETEIAVDGQEAFDKAVSFKPDLINQSRSRVVANHGLDGYGAE